jgi:hypothetical protein
LEILFKPLCAALAVVKVVIEFHAGLAYFPLDTFAAVAGTDSKRTHASTVEIKGADWIEIEKEAVIGFLWVDNVAGVSVLVVRLVEGRRILDTETAMGVLTMQAFLIAVDHCLPVELAWICKTASVGKFAEIAFVEKFEEG